MSKDKCLDMDNFQGSTKSTYSSNTYHNILVSFVSSNLGLKPHENTSLQIKCKPFENIDIKYQLNPNCITK